MANIALRLPVMSVGPDAASHQVYYDAVDCVFSSYTYTNYGNFTLTITTGANSTFIITVPANPYSEARTAGADIIFYDTDGNSYTQTIKVGQEGNAPSPNILIKAEYVTNTVSHEIRIVDRWNQFYDIQFPVGTSIYNDVMGTSGAYTFPSNSYYEVYFYTSATTLGGGVGDGVFENISHLTKIEVINGTEKKLEDFGDQAFNECTRLESAVLPDSITRFGSNTFGGCVSLTGLTLPSCLTLMMPGWAGQGYSSGCPLLTTITANPSVAPKGYPTRYMPNFLFVGSAGTLSYHYTEKISSSAVDMYDEWLVPDSQYANYASLGDKGWSGSYITEIALEESYVAVESGATQLRIPVYEVGCTYSNFTYSVSGEQDIQVALVPGTTHNYDLLLTIPASRSTAATITNIDITFTDTNGNTYTGSSVCGDHTLTIEQAAMASGTFIKFADNQVTFNAIEDPYAGIIFSSCTIDTSRFDIVSVVGDFVIDAEYCKIVRNGTTIHVPSGNDFYFVFTPDHINKTAADLSSDITVRFYDTSGNTYIDTVNVVQTANFWVEFEPEYYVMYGDSGQVCSNLAYINCHPGTEGYNLVAVEKSTEDSPDLSYTYTGNTLCVDVPENTTEEEWFYTFGFSGCIIANEGFSGSSIYNDQETGWTCMDYNPDAAMRNFILVQYPAGTPQDKDIRIDNANFNIGSGTSSTSSTVTVEGTGLSGWTYTTGGSFAVTATTGANNTIVFNVPQNDTNSARTGYVYITFTDTEGNTYQQTVTFYQDAGGQKQIRLEPTVVTATSADTGGCVTIVAENCTYSAFTVTSTGGTAYATGPTVNGTQMCWEFPVNPSGTSRSQTYSLKFYDTDNNEYPWFIVVQQAASGETQNVPEPWNKEGDTAYTWYSDELLLNIMPSQRELSWNERTAYYPVTAHTFGTFEVRASGDCPFIYTITAETDTSFNSHSLYCHTENNSGETQLTSQIKIVAYSGDSAYSATTMLLKDPEASGWITATPDRINASSSASSVNVYLTITNCQRSLDDEAINNDEFNRAGWVTVTLVNNTALTFNFAANMTPTTRSTYYNVCGRDHNDRLISRRVEITQASGTTGIKIIPDRTTLPKAAGSFTARVESTEAGNFSFSASPWMSITSYVPSSEKGGTLYINYSLNSGTTDRTGDIYASQQISTEPFTLTASTSVTQIASAETAYITITPPTVGVGRQAGTVEAQVNYAGLATPPAIVRDAGNMSIVSYNLDSGLITVTYGANDTTVPKNQTFLVTATTLGGQNISASFTITQGGAGQAVAPIWRDYVIDLPTPGQGYINYYISYDGTVVYTGRAYSMGQTNLEIYYNHLCKSFLSNRIDFTSGFQTVTDWLGNFTITSPELGNIASVNFFEDYSYENRHMTNTMTLNNPIINEVVDGGFVPFSFFVTGLSGEISVMENGIPATSFTISDNEQHRYFITAEQGKTYEALGTRYKAISACDARYSLYYVNSYGGVDVLPFKGRSFKKTDNITRLNYSRSFRNNTLEFENVNYMNEIKPAWELNTSFMTDEQSKKMHELVESTIAYLYDAEEQTYTPVVMTDKKLEYKTYFNQGRKFYTYTINVEESQSKERR